MPTRYAIPLAKKVPPQFLEILRWAAHASRGLGFAVFAVGGLPRDLLLRRPSQDLDLVVEGDAIHLARSLAATHGGKVTSHQRFGTAAWETAPPPPGLSGKAAQTIRVDLATARSEVYLQPADLPRVSVDTIETDLRRRDFTINAMAIRLDAGHFGQLLDPMGGRDDVQRKLVRVLHARSFEDDPTRMYRAVRYEQRLGFRISADTIRLLPSGARWVGAVSGERLRNELDLILGEAKAAYMLKRLAALGLLRRVHRSLPEDRRSIRRLARNAGAGHAAATLPNGGWLLWLMELQPASLRSIGRRLAFERQLVEALVGAARLYQSARVWGNWRASRLTLKLDVVPVTAVEAVRVALPPGAARRALDAYLRSWRELKPRTSSRELKALGLEPGPTYGLILRRIRAAWIDGVVRDARAERRLLESLLKRARSRAR